MLCLFKFDSIKGWLLVSVGILVNWVTYLGVHTCCFLCRLHSDFNKCFLLVSCNPHMAPTHRPLCPQTGDICDPFWPLCKWPQSSPWYSRSVAALSIIVLSSLKGTETCPWKLLLIQSLPPLIVVHTYLFVCVCINKSDIRLSICMCSIYRTHEHTLFIFQKTCKHLSGENLYKFPLWVFMLKHLPWIPHLSLVFSKSYISEIV